VEKGKLGAGTKKYPFIFLDIMLPPHEYDSQSPFPASSLSFLFYNPLSPFFFSLVNIEPSKNVAEFHDLKGILSLIEDMLKQLYPTSEKSDESLDSTIDDGLLPPPLPPTPSQSGSIVSQRSQNAVESTQPAVTSPPESSSSLKKKSSQSSQDKPRDKLAGRSKSFTSQGGSEEGQDLVTSDKPAAHPVSDPQGNKAPAVGGDDSPSTEPKVARASPVSSSSSSYTNVLSPDNLYPSSVPVSVPAPRLTPPDSTLPPDYLPIQKDPFESFGRKSTTKPSESFGDRSSGFGDKSRGFDDSDGLATKKKRTLLERDDSGSDDDTGGLIVAPQSKKIKDTLGMLVCFFPFIFLTGGHARRFIHLLSQHLQHQQQKQKQGVQDKTKTKEKEKDWDKDGEKDMEKDRVRQQEAIRKNAAVVKPIAVAKEQLHEVVTAEKASMAVDIDRIRAANTITTTTKDATKGRRKIRLIGRLEEVGANLASDSRHLYVFNQYRAQELVLFERLKSSYVLPRERLDAPLFLDAS